MKTRTETAKRNAQKVARANKLNVMLETGGEFRNWQTEHPAYYGVGYSEAVASAVKRVREAREKEAKKQR